MTLAPATVARMRSALEQYHAAKAKGVVTSLELEVMASRVGKRWLAEGYEILKILEVV